MSSALKWSTPVAWSELFGGTAGTPLNSLTTGSAALSIEYDNGTAKNQLVDLGIYVRMAAAGSGGVVDIYLITEVGAGVFEDGGVGVIPNKVPVATVPIRAVNTAQTVSAPGIFVPPRKCKFLFVNRTGQTLTASTSENKVLVSGYTPEGQ